MHRHIPALAGEVERDGAADTARRTRHERHPGKGAGQGVGQGGVAVGHAQQATWTAGKVKLLDGRLRMECFDGC